ncbi:MAG: CapA family protein [Hyphomicrobiales bacterium]
MAQRGLLPSGMAGWLAVIAIVVFSACGGVRPRARVEVVPPTATVATTAPAATPSATPTASGPRTVTLRAVGDVMLARSVAAHVTEADPAGPFAGVQALLADGDITVGNLECALSERGTPAPKGYTFEAPPLAARGLADAGFDVVAMANNHSMDFGGTALLDSLDALADAGVGVAGAGRDAAEAAAPVIVERNGYRVAFLAFADVPPESGGYDVRSWAAGPDAPGIAWLDPDAVTEAVSRAAEYADFVVVLFHWGIEGSQTVTAAQRSMGHAAIDAGATLVIGSHPHVLQEVEEYGGGLIAYSLGNFVFDGFEGAANETGILSVTLGEDGVESWEMLPAEIGWDGLPRAAGQS